MIDAADRPAHVPRPIAWMDGRVLPAADATVPLLDDGFLRGDAVFETILVRRGRTHALDAHLARMRRSAKAMGIRLPVLRQVVADLLAAWGDRDGALRVIVTRGGAIRGVMQVPVWPESLALEPIEMPWLSAVSGIKTLSYAANVWAMRQAKAAEADDAVIISSGVVHELPSAAILWVRDGIVRAPDPQALPVLESVTLRSLQQVADVELGQWQLDDLLAADEAFVVSATRPVLPVHAVGEREYETPGPETARVRTAFNLHIDANLDPLP